MGIQNNNARYEAQRFTKFDAIAFARASSYGPSIGGAWSEAPDFLAEARTPARLRVRSVLTRRTS